MSIINNVLRNWYSSMKKNEKDLDDFCHGKLTLANFDSLPLIQNTKFNNFLCVC